MTEIPFNDMQAIEELFGAVASFDSRPDVGFAVGIIPRLARYVSGDPIKYFSVSSPSFNNPQILPDEPRAKSASCQVIGNPCFYRMDGTPPALANEQTLPVGAVFLLTGMPSIKGFTFVSTGIIASIIAVTYFD